MPAASKAEIVENLLPREILHQASKVVVNEEGKKRVILENPGETEDKENTITITYNISLEAALASFEQKQAIQTFGSAKARL